MIISHLHVPRARAERTRRITLGSVYILISPQEREPHSQSAGGYFIMMTLRVCERAGGLELRAAPSSSLSDIRTHPHTHKQDNGTKPYKYSLDSTNPTPIRLRLPALVCPYPFGFGGNAPVLLR